MWSNEESNFNKLENDISCDILVIGGGIAGILCAYYLKEEGLDVVLCERDRIGSKKTSKSTATITVVQDLYYYELLNDKGLEYTRLYLNSCLDAIRRYKRLSKKYDFDFEEVPSYRYFTNSYEYENEINTFKKLDFTYEEVDIKLLNLEYYKAYKINNQAQMNPMKLINSLAKELKIYENTCITKIENNLAYANNNHIKANKIIVTTGYPFFKIKGLYPLKLTQNKSYVMVIKNYSSFKGNMIGGRDDSLYFRSYKDYLLIGASDSNVGDNIDGFNDIKEYIQDDDIIYSWVNQDTISLDSIPYIGRYTKNDNDLYVATGFNMYGMTGSMISSMVLTDLILGRNNIYSDIFNPSRALNKQNLLKNICNSMINLIKIKRHRCNHLGCCLNYNQYENTYECPCHGSKYDEHGNVLDGPAIKNIKM